MMTMAIGNLYRRLSIEIAHEEGRNKKREKSLGEREMRHRPRGKDYGERRQAYSCSTACRGAWKEEFGGDYPPKEAFFSNIFFLFHPPTERPFRAVRGTNAPTVTLTASTKKDGNHAL